MRTRHLAAAAVGLGLVASVAGCGADDKPQQHHPVRPQQVRLTAAHLPAETTIGMIVSLQAPAGQGSEWTSAATGAQLAAYRFDAKGHRVELEVVDDHGTAAGARRAVSTLVGDHVAGIVVATSGSHLESALGGAGSTPLLLPYQTSTDGLPRQARLTGPSEDQLGGTVNRFLAAQGWKAPFLVHSETSTLAGVHSDRQLFVNPASEPRAAVAAIKRAQKSGADVVVADLPAATAASLVAALQSAKVDLPVVLGREGASADFGQDLGDDGSLSGQLFTAGTDASDVSSLGHGDSARGTTAYFAAMREAVTSPLAGLFDQGSYRSRAGSSDTASHDAVVALVRAVSQAGSTAPDKVAAALGTLHLDGGDGLAGPALDLTGQGAVADSAVRPLVATDQDPGVRPTRVEAAQKLFWFVVPDASAS